MPRLLLLALASTSLSATVLRAQARPDGRDSVLLEAANVLQGLDSQPFLPPARLREVNHALARLRQHCPQLKGIDAGPDRTLLEVHLQDSVGARIREALKPRLPSSATTQVATTGVSSLDSLSLALRVASISASTVGDFLWGFMLSFREYPNIPVLASWFNQLPEVAYAGPPLYVGDGSFIVLIPKRGTDLYVFSRGGGDCPAGCTWRDYYYFSLDRTSEEIRLERTLLHGDTTGWSDPVALWDIPTRFSVMPYPHADSLFRVVSSPHWGLRLHALWALHQMLGPATAPGAEQQNRVRIILRRSRPKLPRNDWSRSSSLSTT